MSTTNTHAVIGSKVCVTGKEAKAAHGGKSERQTLIEKD